MMHKNLIYSIALLLTGLLGSCGTQRQSVGFGGGFPDKPHNTVPAETVTAVVAAPEDPVAAQPKVAEQIAPAHPALEAQALDKPVKKLSKVMAPVYLQKLKSKAVSLVPQKTQGKSVGWLVALGIALVVLGWVLIYLHNTGAGLMFIFLGAILAAAGLVGKDEAVGILLSVAIVIGVVWLVLSLF